MKYAQLLIGLFAGTALGGAIVVSTPAAAPVGSSTSGFSKADIQQIVRDTISAEPKLILDSVQNYQQDQQRQAMSKANDALKDPAVRDAVFNDATLAFAGNKTGKHVVAEFFDYDCPVCKIQFKALVELIKTDPELKVVFHEFPIFGPTSDENSKIGFAVQHFYPEKYYDFHVKMMGGQGHEKNVQRTYNFAKELGMDVAKLQAYVKSDAATAQFAKARALGDKLTVQGTPTLVIGNEIIPHAVGTDELKTKLDALPK